MRPIKLFLCLVLSGTFINLQAQTEVPRGYKKGSITLSDSNTVEGHIKESLSRDASVSLLQQNGERKTYTGHDLLSVQIDSTRFICIKGDFFKVISTGELSLLQKRSNVSGKPLYNGTEAVFIKGAEGRQGEYFIYNPGTQELLLVHKKNREGILSLFAKDTAATDVARQDVANADRLKDAIEIYNSRSTR